jgi:hypothetical protein
VTTKKAAEVRSQQPMPAAQGAPTDAGTGQSSQYRPEQSRQDNAAAASRLVGRPVRGSSLGYAAAHLGSASVAGLGAIGSAYGLGGVAVAGGLVAGSAAAAYMATRVTRAAGRRAVGGARTTSRTLTNGARVRHPGGRAGGLRGRRGRGAGLRGRRAAAGQAMAGVRPGTHKGLLNGMSGGRRRLRGGRFAVTGGRQPGGLLGASRRAGAGSGPSRTGLLSGGRSRGKGLFGGRSRSGGKGLLGGKRPGSASGGRCTGKDRTGRKSSYRGKGWKRLFTAGGKNAKKLLERLTKNRGTSSDNDALPQAPRFVDDSDSYRGDRSAQRKDMQVPESRRHRGASIGGKNMGYVSDSAETVVTAIAKADISSARKLDAVFDDLAGFEAKVATAKRQLAARIAEEFPADPSISEHVSQSAGLQARLGESLGELRKVFRRAHAMEWDRLDSPRRNEHAWDVTHNQE